MKNAAKKHIKDLNKGIALLARKLSGTTIIFERPEVSFKIHPDLAAKIYHVTDTLLENPHILSNPWVFFDVFSENINNCLTAGKSILIIKYSTHIANQLGSVFLSLKETDKPFSCIAFYHEGESLTTPEPIVDDTNFPSVEEIEAMEETERFEFIKKVHAQYHPPIDINTTALSSMEYFDFIAKVEIPVGFEIDQKFLDSLQ